MLSFMTNQAPSWSEASRDRAHLWLKFLLELSTAISATSTIVPDCIISPLLRSMSLTDQDLADQLCSSWCVEKPLERALVRYSPAVFLQPCEIPIRRHLIQRPFNGLNNIAGSLLREVLQHPNLVRPPCLVTELWIVHDNSIHPQHEPRLQIYVIYIPYHSIRLI